MDLEVAKGDLERVRVSSPASPDLADGEVRVRVDVFALTSNNITYAVLGEMLNYWDFFPAAPADEGDDTDWGRIPVWGFGDVVDSRSSDVEVAERIYGYLPMSSEVVLTAGRGDEQGFSDRSSHRADLPGTYNRYMRCAADPSYRPDREAQQMLLSPLFFTAFMIDDLIADNGDFGAERVIVSSASSKTAIGVAFMAHRRGMPVIALTSPGNAAFVEELGVYESVVSYDELGSLPVSSSVYVDIAGNRDVVHGVHARLGDELRHSLTVGVSHWDHATELAPDAELSGPQPVFFFAPDQIAKRTKDWGPGGVQERVGEAWIAFSDWTDRWLALQHPTGPGQVVGVYRELLAGGVDPRKGFVATLIQPDSPAR